MLFPSTYSISSFYLEVACLVGIKVTYLEKKANVSINELPFLLSFCNWMSIFNDALGFR